MKRRFGDNMKKCEYCGKEITYFEQYCNDDCQRNANSFYEMREKYTGIFSIINGICVFGIPIGIFMFPFVESIGLAISAISAIVLGLTIIALPFPTESMIDKRKIQKAIKLTKIFGLILVLCGVIAFLVDLFLYIL